MRRWPAAPRTSMLTRAERGNAWQARRQPSARSFSEIRLSSRSVGAVSSPASRVSPMGSTKTLGMPAASALGRPEHVGHAVLAVDDLLQARVPHLVQRGAVLVEHAGHADTLLLRLAAFAVALALDVLLGLG